MDTSSELQTMCFEVLGAKVRTASVCLSNPLGQKDLLILKVIILLPLAQGRAPHSVRAGLLTQAMVGCLSR